MNEHDKQNILRYTGIAFCRELHGISPEQDQEQAQLRSELVAEGLSHEQIIRLAAEVVVESIMLQNPLDA